MPSKDDKGARWITGQVTQYDAEFAGKRFQWGEEVVRNIIGIIMYRTVKPQVEPFENTSPNLTTICMEIAVASDACLVGFVFRFRHRAQTVLLHLIVNTR